jgi:peptide-methionine (S)-S-oxide reductase
MNHRINANWLKGWLLAGLFAFGLVAAGPGVAQSNSASVGKELPAGFARATLAGGCFWCMEAPFDKLDGVLSTTSGYIGGKTRDPTYQQVSAGSTGHTEAVEIVFDPKKVSFAKLLDIYWLNVDPTVKTRQFCDSGSQYRPEIFYYDADQKREAEASRAALMKNKPFKADIVVDITQATEFWAAEEYHQDYYKKNPLRYKYYRSGCGRDARLKELWGDKAGG